MNFSSLITKIFFFHPTTTAAARESFCVCIDFSSLYRKKSSNFLAQFAMVENLHSFVVELRCSGIHIQQTQTTKIHYEVAKVEEFEVKINFFLFSFSVSLRIYISLHDQRNHILCHRCFNSNWHSAQRISWESEWKWNRASEPSTGVFTKIFLVFFTHSCMIDIQVLNYTQPNVLQILIWVYFLANLFYCVKFLQLRKASQAMAINFIHASKLGKFWGKRSWNFHSPHDFYYTFRSEKPFGSRESDFSLATWRNT